MYKTPGGTILLAAHRGIESITLDRGAAHLKDELMPRYAELIYNGFWSRRSARAPGPDRPEPGIVAGTCGSSSTRALLGGRPHSPNSLYARTSSPSRKTGAYDQSDAEGFIQLNALRLRMLASASAN